MKRIIRNISLCALLAVAMGACEEEAALVNPSVAHDKSTQSPEEVVEAASLQSASAPGSGLIFRDFVVQTGDELYVELAKPAEHDMTFTIGLNIPLSNEELKALPAKYYNIFIENVIEEPGDKLTITNEGKVTIAKGERKSTRVSFALSRMTVDASMAGSQYLLPLVAMDEDGNQYQLFYSITERDEEYQDRTKKDYKVVAYIDTEVMNPLIADKTTAKLEYLRSRRDRETIYENVPVVDIVNVRKALLGYDASSRRVILKYTPDMEYVLKHNVQYIQPLRRNGLKVCLSIEGGGTGIGFANLTDPQIIDFVAQVKVAVELFQLDGIHLRDEGAGYDKAEAPTVNETSYPKLIKALREAMPDIMLTLADDGGTTATMNKEQEGIVVGDYIDLAWNVIWDSPVNPWADGSERKPIAGMTKERYGGIALYIKERTPEDMGFFEELQAKARVITIDEGLGKVAVVENIPYRQYNLETMVVDGFKNLLMCFHDNNDGNYPKYSAVVQEARVATQFYAFRKDW